MNRLNKILVIFYIFLASSYGIYIFTTSEGLEENLLELVLPQKITNFEIIRLVDVPNNRIFDIMADIENFPNIISSNIVDVTIISKINDVIIAEEEFSESGIKTKLLVKHTIQPYSKHIIEIIDGDAKGTIITQYFESVGSQTKLTTNVHLNMGGVTSVIQFLPESNLKHAVNTIISYFVNYSTYDVYDETVNSIYNEIFLRQADAEGLLHYSELLRNELVTEQDIRNILLNSNEKKFMKIKTIDSLNPKTIILINDLYEKILLRPADPEGMKYFGSLLEFGTTSDEIRIMLLESDEGKNVSSLHPIRSEIKIIYLKLFDIYPTDSEINYYHKMIDDGLMTITDVKKELEKFEEYKNIHD